ncbi:MAG: CopD family protein [Burkholderiaceae bacterium]|nr:CopD family protein [Burkholderiaceae bacterium]
MIYNLLKLAHLLSIIVWIGGMVFAHFYLRPAVQSLQPPQRVQLMHDVLQRFLNSVLVAAIVVLGTGLWMIGRVAKQAVQSGGSFSMPLSWTIMATLGIIMITILGHIRFALFKRLKRAVAASDWAAGGNALGSIRTWVGVNLAIGVVIVGVTLLLK